MLNNQKEFRTGLCRWAKWLYYSDIITYQEYVKLRSFIEANRPSKYSSLSAYAYKNDDFYWTPGVIKHRVKWIKQQIKLLSK